MSNLQVLARRCPVMGKAMTVQNAASLSGVYGGTRAYRSRASLHTTTTREATVAADILRRTSDGMFGFK